MTSVNLRAGKRLLLALPHVLGRYLETRKITAWLHLAAKPARARLDEFLSGRCPDRIRCLRRLLSCRSGLAERSGRSGAYCWDSGWRHQSDSWRRVCRALRWKRGLAAIGIGMLCASALILALVPNFVLVFLAEILHGLTAGIVTPAIAAISLGLVGRRAMSVRTGRNYQFNAAGNAITAGLMGLAGQYFATSAIFFGPDALR